MIFLQREVYLQISESKYSYLNMTADSQELAQSIETWEDFLEELYWNHKTLFESDAIMS